MYMFSYARHAFAVAAAVTHDVQVHETITALKQQVQESSNQHLFPPLEVGAVAVVLVTTFCRFVEC